MTRRMLSLCAMCVCFVAIAGRAGAEDAACNMSAISAADASPHARRGAEVRTGVRPRSGSQGGADGAAVTAIPGVVFSGSADGHL